MQNNSQLAIPDFTEPDPNDPIDRMLLRLPIVDGWVRFKGETFYTSMNYDATVKAKKPMMDIFYCATTCLNHAVLKTVQWDKKKFLPSHLGISF